MYRRLIGASPNLALAAAACAVLILSVAPAWCAEGKAPAPSEGMLIGEVVLLIVAGRLLGEGMLRLGQPAVMGQLIAGLLLGPSVLGVLWPDAQHFLFPKMPEQKAMLDGIAQFGILLLLLLAGMETELSLVRDVRRAAFSASLSGIALPFACGMLLGHLLPELADARSGQAADNVAFSWHRTFDLVGEDRRQCRARHGLYAPQCRADHSRLRDRR